MVRLRSEATFAAVSVGEVRTTSSRVTLIEAEGEGIVVLLLVPVVIALVAVLAGRALPSPQHPDLRRRPVQAIRCRFA